MPEDEQSSRLTNCLWSGSIQRERDIHKGGDRMKVKEGDVLICTCNDCTIELTVTKACNPDACGIECDINASCCDGTMEIKKK